MKKNRYSHLIACLPIVFLFTACAASRCECENNYPYKQRKAKVSLISNQKNITFALRNEGKKNRE